MATATASPWLTSEPCYSRPASLTPLHRNPTLSHFPHLFSSSLPWCGGARKKAADGGGRKGAGDGEKEWIHRKMGAMDSPEVDHAAEGYQAADAPPHLVGFSLLIFPELDLERRRRQGSWVGGGDHGGLPVYPAHDPERAATATFIRSSAAASRVVAGSTSPSSVVLPTALAMAMAPEQRLHGAGLEREGGRGSEAPSSTVTILS